MSYALKGGVAAGLANMTIMKDLYAQSSGPIVIGHHAEITGALPRGAIGMIFVPKKLLI